MYICIKCLKIEKKTSDASLLVVLCDTEDHWWFNLVAKKLSSILKSQGENKVVNIRLKIYKALILRNMSLISCN